MSRHVIDPLVPLVVGYDPTAQNFFAQVFETQPEPSLEEQADPVEHSFVTIEEMAVFVRKNFESAKIPQQIQNSLRNERFQNELHHVFLDSNSSKRYPESDLNRLVRRKFHFQDLPQTTVYFDNLQKHFLDCIEAHDAALCAMYTLTDTSIIKALASRRCVSVILDGDRMLNGKSKCDLSPLRDHDGFDGRGEIEVQDKNGESHFTICDELDGLRVLNYEKRKAGEKGFESFHTKFCVFADVVKDRPFDSPNEFRIFPKSVWLGSYNPTPTGDGSIQASVVLREREVVTAFASEFFSLHRSALSYFYFQRDYLR